MAKPVTVFRFYTGPAWVDQVALRLSEAGFKKTRAGTEHAYFEMPNGQPALTDEAQAAVDEVYPYAGYRVEPCLFFTL